MKSLFLAKECCKRLLQEPGTSGLSIDSPEATIVRWQIIRNKPFLRQIYKEWYQAIAESICSGEQPALEIGSGAGFMPEFVPNLICSDIQPLPKIDMLVDACQLLPFESESLRAIAMINVLHHLPYCEGFFAEAQRCLAPGGTINMIEPWVSDWSSFVYRYLHHEPFIPEAADWTFDSTGPLSGANQALPWIIFARDRSKFQERFSNLQIESIELIMPIRYLLSGGVSLRAFVPSWSYNFWVGLENSFQSQMSHLAMFAKIVVRKTI